jgi:hypothetical protein
LGVDPTQDMVFRKRLLHDAAAYWEGKYLRQRGRFRLATCRAGFAWHAYLQAGLRANEVFGMRVEEMRSRTVFGEVAVARDVLPHMFLAGSLQTKEERYAKTFFPCAYEAKTSPLCAGKWEQRLERGLAECKQGEAEDLVWVMEGGGMWTMGYFWAHHVRPMLVELQADGLGGLMGQDLDTYGGNSFRRTWATLAAALPDRVSPDLMERQGRWRKRQRKRQALSLPMYSWYQDPDIDELLLATHHL